MSEFYEKHIFFCTNQKEEGKKCCAQADAQAMWQYARECARQEGLTAGNKVRINKAGCLGRCAEGPCLVVYPRGTWYTYKNEADIEAIIEHDLRDDQLVERLLLSKSSSFY
jgi:(2Fe-2S) ferredoxin